MLVWDMDCQSLKFDGMKGSEKKIKLLHSQ